jgi:hypothetical protein
LDLDVLFVPLVALIASRRARTSPTASAVPGAGSGPGPGVSEAFISTTFLSILTFYASNIACICKYI